MDTLRHIRALRLRYGARREDTARRACLKQTPQRREITLAIICARGVMKSAAARQRLLPPALFHIR